MIIEILLTIALFVCGCVILHLKDELNKEQTQRQIQQEREDIVFRMLFGYYKKLLLDTEDSYINKDQVIERLIGALNVQKHVVLREGTDTAEGGRGTSGEPQR